MRDTRTASFSHITLECFGATLTGSCARSAHTPTNAVTNPADNETFFIFVPPIGLPTPQMTAGFAADSGHCVRSPEKRQALRLLKLSVNWTPRGLRLIC